MEESHLKLSVIIPMYNVESYIARCLTSVLDSLSDSGWSYEVICIDDGSSDKTIQKAEICKADDVKLIKTPNKGVGAARNIGLAIATGDWVAFVDGDDQVAKNWFPNAYNIVCDNPDADIVHMYPIVSVLDELSSGRSYCRWKSVSEARKNSLAPVRRVKVFKDERATIFAHGLFAKHGWPVMNFVRRDFIRSALFPEDLRLKEDVVFFMDLATRVKGLVLAEYPGYFYTRREGSAVMRRRSDDDSLKFAKSLVELGNKHDTEIIWRSISSAMGYDFVQWADERDPAVKYNPDVCELRSLWKDLLSSGRLHLSVMHWWWSIAICHWLNTGDLCWAHKIRRIREWAGRLI